MDHQSPKFSVGAFLLSPTIFTWLVACLVLLVIYLKFGESRNRYPPPPPQPAGSWPIIGHFHLLSGPDVMHRALGKLADEYGPIFMLKLGVLRALVVSNSEMAKECMSTHDVAFSDRPRTLAFKIFGYNYAMFVASPYGPYWRELRKITSLELLSNRRLPLLKQTTMSELRASIRELYHHHDRCGWDGKTKKQVIKVDLSKWFADLVLNTLLNLIAGKSLRGFSDPEEREHCLKAFRAFFRLLGEVTVSDALPFLKWLDIGGHERTLKKAAAKLDAIVQGWMDDHRRDRVLLGLKEKRDFMDVLLDLLDQGDHGKFFDYDTGTVIKATSQLMALGGADTTSWTLTWAVSLLPNHPDILKQAKEELNIYIGRQRTVNDSDLNHLPYLQAIVKETMRLYPGAPINPRESNTDVVIRGYYVPAGTRIFINIHKIHRDPLLYPNPDQFLPERFLISTTTNADDHHQDSNDIREQDFEFLPFGRGRRVCPGASYALQAVLLILSNLLHSFDITPPSSSEPIDMSEGHGITNVKVTPLEVLLIPVLPPHLYET